MNNRLIKSNDAGGGGCTNTVDLYNPFPDGGGLALYQLNGDATDVSENYDGADSNVTWGGAGVFGTSAAFNGSSSKISTSITTTNTGIDFNNRLSNFTFSAWFNTTALDSTDRRILSIGEGATSYRYIGFKKVNSEVRFEWYTGAAGGGVIHPISANTWYNIVGVRENGYFKLYINGSFIGQAEQTVNNTITSSATLTIGAHTPSTNWFNGSIDQVRIFNRALRPYEVESLYTEEYCTPTIVPSEHFNTVTYTGNGSTQSITGVGFQPDFTWIKARNNTYNHMLQDSVRGNYRFLTSAVTNAENTNSNRDWFNSFDSDGFTVSYLSSDSTPTTEWNNSGEPYVAWNFKAGGAAVTNTDGTITSQVSANTEAGFSIVKWTGNGVNNATVGHGLDSTPVITIRKRLDSAVFWGVVYNNTLTSNIGSPTNYLILNDTAAEQQAAQLQQNDSVFYTTNTYDSLLNSEWIAYCFAEVEGFSSIGSYVGTGAAGNPIVTGFEPAFVMVKRSSSTGNWVMYDNKRDLENPRTRVLYADDPYQELPTPDVSLNILENGFEINGTSTGVNASGSTYIYMAFAADPTTVEPSLENSFNTVTYTGNGTLFADQPRAITGVGFQPDFTWIKSRTGGAYNHNVFDSVRGAGKLLLPNLTNAEITAAHPVYLDSFDNDGFTVNTLDGGGVNENGQNYVAWNWKGAELPAINSNGSIPSVVSANPAAGFSIVSYTNSTSGTADQRYTIGHGLDSAPDLIITKVRNVDGYRWTTYNSFNGTGQYMALNETRASTSFSRAFPVIPSSTVFTLDEAWPHPVNASAIAYCFHSVAGFSKFGSYNGTGSAGNFQYCGFEPAFVMLKSSSAGNWRMWDNKRSPSDPRNRVIIANGSNSEFYPDVSINFTSTGFSFNTSGSNDSGQTFIYMAFANQF